MSYSFFTEAHRKTLKWKMGGSLLTAGAGAVAGLLVANGHASEAASENYAEEKGCGEAYNNMLKESHHPHYDPSSGQWLKTPELSPEDCGSACQDVCEQAIREGGDVLGTYALWGAGIATGIYVLVVVLMAYRMYSANQHDPQQKSLIHSAPVPTTASTGEDDHADTVDVEADLSDVGPTGTGRTSADMSDGATSLHTMSPLRA